MTQRGREIFADDTRYKVITGVHVSVRGFRLVIAIDSHLVCYYYEPASSSSIHVSAAVAFNSGPIMPPRPQPEVAGAMPSSSSSSSCCGTMHSKLRKRDSAPCGL